MRRPTRASPFLGAAVVVALGSIARDAIACTRAVYLGKNGMVVTGRPMI